MSHGHFSDGPLQPAAEELLFRFDQAWRRGPPPPLADYLPPGMDPASRRRTLENLIKIDLEYRWRLPPDGRAKPPRLEDYLPQFPELGPREQWSAQLIGEEYLVRHLWGDKPGHAEYTARFAQQGAALLEALRQIDRELVCEFAPHVEGTSAGAPPPAIPVAAVVLPVASSPALLETLRSCGLLSPLQINELMPNLAGYPDPRALARELLKRDWLTPYQANQALAGRGADLVLGRYLLLERLGEGGAGQVFKARDQRLQRIVALKLLRKELLSDPDLVARFYREIRVVSQLSHPNVVHAYDAGPVGATHCLAMEYVEGTDLAKLVKQKGPLSVAQACDYIRQAALGLQHAHERGLVHRDIKPHNLMAVASGQWSEARKDTTTVSLATDHWPLATVKILDLGLARLRGTANTEVTASIIEGKASSLTPLNAVMMGTTDYMAPEQALDFHAADVRADVYSLGCTFHFLLTGQPPFAGGTVAQKLLWHQQAEPPDVRQSRPDVPSAVVALLKRMLAKRPEDRYQTAAEVADALAGTPSAIVAAVRRPAWRRRRVLAVSAASLLAAGLGWMALRPSAPRATAAGEFQRLLARRDRGRTDPQELWQELLAFRRSYPDTPEALQAAELLRQDLLSFRRQHPGTPQALQADALFMQLPSALDELQRDRIKDAASWPKEVVAILRDPGQPREQKMLLAISQDGRWIAVSGARAAIHLWDAATGELRHTLRGHGENDRLTALAFAPDGSTLATASTDESTTLKLWNVLTREELTTVTFNKWSWVARLAFAPDGRTVALGVAAAPPPPAEVPRKSGSVQLWDTTTRKHLALLPPGGNNLTALAFAPDGKSLAVADDSQLVTFWKVTGERLRRLNMGKETARALAYAPDGQLAVGTTNGLQLWANPQHDDKPRHHFRDNAALFVAFAPKGNQLAWSNGTRLWLSSTASGELQQQWAFQGRGGITDLAFASDGRHLAVAFETCIVCILRLAAN